jgi:2-phospho-L-lactate guanylyltransferase (CobY/MobA/RfbA family)
MAGMRHCFAIPIKDFAIAKSRLRSANVSEVSQLARTLATGVIHELGGSQVTVLCESEVVSEFALALGCNVAFSAVRGLNESVQGFYDSITAMYDRITVVHADLADPTGLRDYQPQSEVGIITDQQSRGTNVISVPTGVGFRFQFGDSSLGSHRAEALRLGLTCEVLDDGPWIADVDLPEDLV